MHALETPSPDLAEWLEEFTETFSEMHPQAFLVNNSSEMHLQEKWYRVKHNISSGTSRRTETVEAW